MSVVLANYYLPGNWACHGDTCVGHGHPITTIITIYPVTGPVMATPVWVMDTLLLPQLPGGRGRLTYGRADGQEVAH